MGVINFTGLASGLDTRAVVDAILNFERQPVTRLEERRQLYSQRNAALEELRAKLNSFESALRDISSTRTFRGRTTTISDESFLRATASAGAETGQFSIDINNLAAAHKVKSDGFSAADQGLVADGTITIQSGGNNLIQIDVAASSGNNSLEAIRDAINSADAGVQASILFDGTNYLLTVRAEETGTASALTISDGTDLNLDAGANLVSAAADASLTVDGIDVTSASNKISTVIPGVTLDLLSATAGSSVTLEVAQDNDTLVEGVQELVARYNELNEFFTTQFDRANPGVLAGDATTRQIQTRVQSLFTRGVDGIPFGGIRSLSSIGISFDGKTGDASLDGARLRELLDTRFDEIGSLFLSSGSASDPRIRFASSTGATQPGSYDVTVTSAAEQASVVGSRSINGTINAAETLTITVGGQSVDVLLTSGSNITQVVDAVNSALSAAGARATASDDAGALRISSRDYGSAVQIDVVSTRNAPPNGKSSGFGTTVTSDTGEDVVGTIGGIAAVGSGQILRGADGEAFEGLSILVLASSADVTATGGDFGTVSFSRGLIDSIVSQVAQFTRLGDGVLETTGESFERRIEQITDDIERLENKLSLREAQLLKQFAAAERAISALQAQQGALSGFNVL